MDPFTVVLIGGLVALILWIVILGKFAPGSGLEQLGWKSAQQIYEKREALDVEDLDQMLAAHNERRRKRGEADLTVEDLEMRVAQDISDQRRRREELQAERLEERDLGELLETTNARRRARGLPERTLEEVKREFDPAAQRAPMPPPGDSSS